MRTAVRKRLRYAVTAAMPRPAADTAEQTVSAIIRSSRAGRSGMSDFVPSILHRRATLGPCRGLEIREI
ncbi:hypothetical protein GCM10010385_69350 [Streptomyces geysiriensis]|nr:hypothetical protein GCM10010385_69350 [Streptomyces geysiriensis]